MRRFIIMVSAGALLTAAFAFGAAPDDIVGLWVTEKSEARIDIYKCGTKYCGKIAWLKEPAYPAGSKKGIPGSPLLDHNNPDPNLRKNPRIGSQILFDFVYTGENLWKNGKIYNADNGKVYRSKMTLISPDKLKLRGFIGISLIGGSTVWTRTKAGRE
jgi:uncharacterized protein (DUF2147 family)